jgi:hypothetical protein
MSTLPGKKGDGTPQPIEPQTILKVGPPLIPRAKDPPAKPPPPKATSPAAPAKTSAAPSKAPASVATTDAAWESVDALLENLDSGQKQEGAGRAFNKSPSGGMSNARELFGQVATVHVRHVRDFMIDLNAGQATIEWLALTEPAVKQIRQMAEQLAIAPLCRSLDDYITALAAASDAGFSISGEIRQKILDAYEPLEKLMPETFSLANAQTAREGVIVRALLLQVPGVHKVALDKLVAAGLTTLAAYFVARPDEVAATTGLDVAVAEKIVQRFARYRDEMQSAAVDESRTFEHARLADLAAELDAHNLAYDAEKGAKKRDVRKAREATLLEIKVLLARIGEVERARSIDTLSFAQKVKELDEYLKARAHA